MELEGLAIGGVMRAACLEVKIGSDEARFLYQPDAGQLKEISMLRADCYALLEIVSWVRCVDDLLAAFALALTLLS